MKSSFFLTATSALLAVASPVNKRVVVEEVFVTAVDTVTVWVDQPTATAAPVAPAVFTDEAAPELMSTTTSIKSYFGNGGKHRPRPTATTSPEATRVPVTPAEPAPVETAPANPEPVVSTPVAAAPSAKEAPAAAPTDLRSASLFHHNLHRANHSVGDVTWNDALAAAASITSNKCVFAHDMNVNDLQYGQNIASWGSTDNAAGLGVAGAMGMAITSMWYNGEINLYPGYESEPDMSNFEKWGHYSQLIWKETTEIGCSATLCEAGKMYSMPAWYMVCNYKSAGNVGTQYTANVKAPLGQASYFAA